MPTSRQQERADTGVSQPVDETDDRKPRAKTSAELAKTANAKSSTGPRKRPRADSLDIANMSQDEESHQCSEDDNINVEESQEARLRKRNAMYSKRKYIRKKIEIEVLQDQRKACNAENQRLLREHERLKRLLAQSEECVDMYSRRDWNGLAAIQVSVLMSSSGATARLQTGPTTNRQVEFESSLTAAALGQLPASSLHGNNLSPFEALAMSAASGPGYHGMAFYAGQGQHWPPASAQGTNMLSSMDAMARTAGATFTGGARSVAGLQALARQYSQQAPGRLALSAADAGASPRNLCLSVYDRFGQEAAGFFASPTLSMNQARQLMAQSLALSQVSPGGNILLGPDFALSSARAAAAGAATGNLPSRGASNQPSAAQGEEQETRRSNIFPG
jgi:hypothetical protein